MEKSGFALILYFRMVAHKATSSTYQMFLLNLCRQGTVSAGVESIFHSGF